QAWLADVLARMPDMPVSRLPDLLPWNWARTAASRQAAA
ncbi:MAG: transposase domain-containing protein, partial [Bradyrhizobium sp.]|nr:transposase domain-containing protein [Bradyrhizobium sp.]